MSLFLLSCPYFSTQMRRCISHLVARAFRDGLRLILPLTPQIYPISFPQTSWTRCPVSTCSTTLQITLTKIRVAFKSSSGFLRIPCHIHRQPYGSLRRIKLCDLLERVKCPSSCCMTARGKFLVNSKVNLHTRQPSSIPSPVFTLLSSFFRDLAVMERQRWERGPAAKGAEGTTMERCKQNPVVRQSSEASST